jgi:electron transfer flavoprotein alpha subunit
MITVRTIKFEPAAAEGGFASVESISGGSDSGLSSWISQAVSNNDQVDLTSAKIVVSGGRGMQSGDNFHLLHSVAVTRCVCDNSSKQPGMNIYTPIKCGLYPML